MGFHRSRIFAPLPPSFPSVCLYTRRSPSTILLSSLSTTLKTTQEKCSVDAPRPASTATSVSSPSLYHSAVYRHGRSRQSSPCRLTRGQEGRSGCFSGVVVVCCAVLSVLRSSLWYRKGRSDACLFWLSVPCKGQHRAGSWRMGEEGRTGSEMEAEKVDDQSNPSPIPLFPLSSSLRLQIAIPTLLLPYLCAGARERCASEKRAALSHSTRT